MAINMRLLRRALCDGAFSYLQRGLTPPDLRFESRGPLTVEILEAVSLMTEEQVNERLNAYRAEKLSTLNGQLSTATTELQSIQDQIADLG